MKLWCAAWGLVAWTAGAQMPLLPVVQGAFANPGLGVGLNVGGSGSAGVAGGAISWTPESAHLMATIGLGASFGGGTSTTLEYGARLAIPLTFWGPERAVGVAAFAGIGGTGETGDTSAFDVPVGVALGWRAPLGGSRSVEVSLSPFYLLEHAFSRSAPGRTTGELRAALGVGVALTPRIGLTLGGEIGTRRHGVLGAGLSYQLRSH